MTCFSINVILRMIYHLYLLHGCRLFSCFFLMVMTFAHFFYSYQQCRRLWCSASYVYMAKQAKKLLKYTSEPIPFSCSVRQSTTDSPKPIYLIMFFNVYKSNWYKDSDLHFIGLFLMYCWIMLSPLN